MNRNILLNLPWTSARCRDPLPTPATWHRTSPLHEGLGTREALTLLGFLPLLPPLCGGSLPQLPTKHVSPRVPPFSCRGKAASVPEARDGAERAWLRAGPRQPKHYRLGRWPQAQPGKQQEKQSLSPGCSPASD